MSDDTMRRLHRREAAAALKRADNWSQAVRRGRDRLAGLEGQLEALRARKAALPGYNSEGRSAADQEIARLEQKIEQAGADIESDGRRVRSEMRAYEQHREGARV